MTLIQLWSNVAFQLYVVKKKLLLLKTYSTYIYLNINMVPLKHWHWIISLLKLDKFENVKNCWIDKINTIMVILYWSEFKFIKIEHQFKMDPVCIGMYLVIFLTVVNHAKYECIHIFVCIYNESLKYYFFVHIDFNFQ